MLVTSPRHRRIVRPMRTFVAAFTTLLLVSCGSADAETESTTPDTTVSHTPGDDQPVVGDDGPADCPEGSQPHEGMPEEGCDAVHAGCCFATAAEACAHAGCAEEDCVIMESYPVQVRCD